MKKETYEKPELKKQENLKTITLLSSPRVTAEKHEMFIGDEGNL